MDLKKALNQTVRELKREVNKKVLKVPEIETKVLEATSNEPWGPHGSLMTEISHATHNYNEYQMIMSILWKRTLDTGRNWRHVYKAITVFEFLVAHGAERVIDELRERSYQISMLADFQYIDSSGRDQGMNVRKKAQTLASLINDKEKIREVRQKASSNKDKYRGLASTGGLYNKSSSYSSTGGTYGTEDEDRYGRYGRDRDDDRYGRYNSDHQRDDVMHGKDGDRYGRADQNRDDQEEDRNNSVKTNRDYDKYGKDQDRPYDDDDRYSSRSGGGKHDEYIEDERRSDSKQAGSRMPPPPSYEDALTEGGKGAKNLFVQAQNVPSTNGTQNGFSNAAGTEQGDDFDFDPRGSSVSASDFFGQQSVELSFATKALPPPAAVAQPPAARSVSSDMFGDTGFNSSVSGGVSSTPAQQPHLEGDLFGDSPFKADGSTSSMTTPSAEGNVFMNSTLAAAFPAMPVNADVSNSFNPPPLTGGNIFAAPAASAANTNFPTVTAPSYGDSFKAVGPGTTTQPGYEANFMGDNKSFNSFGSSGIIGIGNVPMQTQQQPRAIQSQQPDLMFSFDSQTSSMKAQPKKEKFETKSSVWSNELSNGLIDLNIAGPKSNPLAELGIDLSSSSSLRMERKKEEAKTSTSMGKAMGSGSGVGMAGASVLAPQTAPRPMMGGMGMGMGMGIGMGGMGMGMGMGMAPAPAGMNMGMGMMGMGMQNPNMGMGMGMGMRMGMGGSPALSMGGGPGMGMARPMGMGVGMNGGYPNQQHSYNGPM